MNTAGDLRYAGGEIAVQIGDSVVDGTISMIKGTKQVSQSVQTAGDVWKTEAVRIEEMIRAEEERAAEEARIAEEQAAQAAALEATQLEAANVMAGEQELLAALIYCEAGNQPYEGQVAVGAVVMNRVRSGSYPNTISEVIYQSGQFGPAMTGWLIRFFRREAIQRQRCRQRQTLLREVIRLAIAFPLETETGESRSGIIFSLNHRYERRK